MLRTDPDAVVILDVFAKKTRTTPRKVIEACRERLRRYDESAASDLLT
jgi:phage-related protein